MDKGFNIDDYLNDPDFEGKLESYRELMIIEAIEHNYQNIVDQGLSDWHLREMDKSELTGLKETLVFMTKHFLDLEEYEKCGALKIELDKIEGILERV
tara:strand:+ start:1263 stop:1556 length:294 start_codon:yes stop_codon:yes gene_type:complete